MRRFIVVLSFAALMPACGFLAEPVSNSLSLDVNAAVVPQSDIGFEVEELVMAVDLSPQNPSFTLPDIYDTSKISAILNFDKIKRDRSEPSNLDLSFDFFSFTGDFEVDFDIRIFSRVGAIDDRDLDFVPTVPPSCSFTLNPDTAVATDFPSRVETCITEWVDQNGVPYDFDMEVTTSQGGPARQTTQPYAVSGEWTMKQRGSRISTGRDYDFLSKLRSKDDLMNNLEFIDCSGLSFQGTGSSTVPIQISGSVQVWNNGKKTVSAKLENKNLPAGEYFLNGGPAIDPSANVRVTFTPNIEGFIGGVLEAAKSTTGEGKAKWDVDGDFPRDGTITGTLTGDCSI